MTLHLLIRQSAAPFGLIASTVCHDALHLILMITL
jgi:hypothetical protein